MQNFNENWDGVKRNTLSEKYYAKGLAKDEVQHILPKWVYEKFFDRLKGKGKNFLFNQAQAEAALENIFNLTLNPRSPFSRIRDYGQMYVEAEADYMKKMGLGEQAEPVNWDGIVREAVEYKINDPRLVKAAHAALSPKHSSDPAKVTKMAQVMWNMWAHGDGTVKVAELARLARVKLGYE